MPLPTDVLGPALLDLLACAEGSFPDEDLPGRRFVAPGLDVAWDDCCEGSGQLWVRVLQTQPSGNPFPAPLPASRSKCDWPLVAVTVGVGVLRCTPTVDDRGIAPSAAALTESALQMTADRAVLEQAVRCCWPDVRNVEAITGVSWVPLGPNGGCAGGEWTATLALGTCRCP